MDGVHEGLPDSRERGAVDRGLGRGKSLTNDGAIRPKTTIFDAVIRAAADGCTEIAIVCSGGPDHLILRKILSEAFGATRGLRKMEMVVGEGVQLTFRFVPWGEAQTKQFCRVLVHDAYDDAAVRWVRDKVAKGCPIEEVFA